MLVATDTSLSGLPSFEFHPHKSPKPELGLQTDIEDVLNSNILKSNQNMAGFGSPTPRIKDEPDDGSGNSIFLQQSQYPNQQQYGTSQTDYGSVNPSDLTMSGSFVNQFGSHNMSTAFTMPNGGIGDDELLELGNLDDQNGQGFNGFEQGNTQQQQHGYFQDGSMTMNNPNGHINQVFSHTPDGAPIQSPFVRGFDYGQFQSMQARQGYAHGMSTSANVQSSSFDVNGRRHKMPGFERTASDGRSPMTPKTPALGIGGIHIGTPESGSLGSQPIMTNAINHRHQQSISSQWDNTPGSGHSWIDSPLPSPHTVSMHPQISEVLSSGKHASLPTKVEGGMQSASVPAMQSQEAKRRRRRESHNMVERRRRDNINERIQDLSRLVPQHRLEDEKVRKHIHNNGPLSPSIAASGISPPQATSLLAAGGRRAAGNITQGLPIEEKDKGPNKGDILNGAVSWTRDLMWMLYMKIQQVDELKHQVEQLGGAYTLDETEEEKRMRSELVDAVKKNGTDSFRYSRGPGSGLRVPKHTNVAGDPLHSISPQGLSPGVQSGGSGANSGSSTGQPQFWINQQGGSNGHDSFTLKEEDEYNNMEM